MKPCRIEAHRGWKARPMMAALILSFLMLDAFLLSAEAIRIKDMATIGGARDNQLIGYGLVVGLNGTGDNVRTEFTVQSLTSMLQRMGVTVNPDDVRVDNVAAVMVTATLRSFARAGSRLDALVSSLGDAESLLGGTLLLTPLRGADGKVYAVAQGPVSIGGGFSFSGSTGSSVQKNHPTVGYVANGATVEREVPYSFYDKRELRLSLHNPDFITAVRLSKAINKAVGEGMAEAKDAGTVEVKLPDSYPGDMVEFVAKIESLDVKPDVKARVIIDERNGTVVMGENVRISTVAISHGNLSIVIKEQPEVSQPAPFSQGETVEVPTTEITVEEAKEKLVLVEEGVTLSEVIRALNAIGVTPRDLIAILQAIKAAGALQAELEII